MLPRVALISMKLYVKVKEWTKIFESRQNGSAKGAQVIIEIKPEWGSQVDNHRVLIRQGLKARYASEAASDLLDLEVLPKLKKGFVSISHARGLGGYAYSADWLGFDLETDARVRPELAARISTMEEFSAAPDAASLWCAKEAAYKALAFVEQPTMVTDFSLAWHRRGSDFIFTMNEAARFGVVAGHGVVRKLSGHTMAVFQTRALGSGTHAFEEP